MRFFENNDPEIVSKPYVFDKGIWDAIELPSSLKSKLCLDDENRVYTLVGEGFSFPDSNDNPVVNAPDVPASFWWDGNSETPKLLLQLGPHFPPVLWLPVKPDYEALKRVFSEFLSTDAATMQKHLLYYEDMQAAMEAKAGQPLAQIASQRMRDLVVDNRRKVDPSSIENDWPNSHRIFLGTVDYFKQAEDSFMNNPFIFAWPVLLGSENHYQIDNPLKSAVFRTVYSKSMLFIEGREDLQYDPTLSDEENVAVTVPLFLTVNYPTNQRMCGGPALVRRFNRLLNCNHALDTPVDVLAACIGNIMKGVSALKEELDALAKSLLHASSRNDAEQLNSLVAMLITHLAVLRDENWKETVFERFRFSDSVAVRVACAKGACELGMKDEIESMLRHEEDSPRMIQLLQYLLSKLEAEVN